MPSTPLHSALAHRLLQALGWRVVTRDTLPRQAVLIFYPHTSNWDFIYAMLCRAALGVEALWVAKDTLFFWPLGIFMRALGGIPVNRRERTGFVERVAAQFSARDKLILAIAPEGTRRLTPGWKSGFYRIALAARVPVLLGCADYARREVGIVGCVELTGDEAADMAQIAAAYAGRHGRHAGQASPVVILR